MGSVLLVEDVNLKMGGRGEEEKKKRKIDVTFSCSCSAVLPSRRLMKEVDLSSQTLAWFSP